MKHYDVVIDGSGPIRVIAENREQAIDIACDRIYIPQGPAVAVAMDTATGIAIKYEIARV